MDEITGFSVKDSLSAPGLGWKNFISLGTEEDEPIYTYNDIYMRWIVWQSIKGRVCALNQYYISNICGKILKNLSRELDIEGNVYDFIETYMIYKNDQLKTINEEYESKFNDYRDTNEKEMEKHIKKIR